jgi:hypothetical protein
MGEKMKMLVKDAAFLKIIETFLLFSKITDNYLLKESNILPC